MAEHDTYYHHTDKDSAAKIIKSRKILQSEQKNGDAVMGNGIYLTQFGPSISKDDVAKNNFDGLTKNWEDKIKDGKTDVVFEMTLPKHKVQNHSTVLKRDVYLHRGNINLSKVKDVKIHVKTGDKTYKTVNLTK